MRVHRWSQRHVDGAPLHLGVLAVRVLLSSALLPAILPGASGRTPFGVPRLGIGLLLALVLGEAAAGVWRRGGSRRRRTVRVALLGLVVAALAAGTGRVVEARANAFYTAAVLADALGAMLVVHLVGAALRRGAATRAAGARTAIADHTESLAACALGAFWLVAAGGMYEVGGLLLIAAGALLAATVPPRFGEAWLAASLGERLRARRHGRRVAAKSRQHASRAPHLEDDRCYG